MDLLNHQLQTMGLSPWLERDDVTEICVNRPGEYFVEANGRWHHHHSSAMTYELLRSFCVAAVNESRTGQRITEQEPLVSLTFPGGQRAQLVIPPACEAGRVSITLRVPSRAVRDLQEYSRQGYFEGLAASSTDRIGSELRELMARERWVEFFTACVRARKNIVVAGATGSGKTSFMRSLVRCIAHDERLITVEDARELFIEQRNAVHLLYSKGGQGIANITARQCIDACLRMRPDRILLAELRGDEAFHYLRSCATGHPGSITSCHAGSAAQAWHQLALMVKASPEGSYLDLPTIHGLLRSAIDVMVHIAVIGGQRRVTGVILPEPLVIQDTVTPGLLQ